uniref:Disease resistance protein At4g27190-like leucine-rich repeats domain-containing protein n=1 Tax=Populus davidiana TaxID=266767 RepID=A0A6M2ED34_9ROSI
MEEIIGTTDEESSTSNSITEFILPKLKTLELKWLPELKSICNAKLTCDSLQQIEVRNCDNMESLVPYSWISLINLEEITVAGCKKMKAIIGGTRSDEESSSNNKLKRICSAKLMCDSLQQIEVSYCNSMESLVPSSAKLMCDSEFKLSKLRELELEDVEQDQMKKAAATAAPNSNFQS